MKERNNGIERRRGRERGEPPRDIAMSLSEQAVKPGRFDKLQLWIRGNCQFLVQYSTIRGKGRVSFKNYQSQKETLKI